MSRQSTTHHLDRLLASRLVRRTDDERYVLDAQRLFAMVDGLRELARLRPLVAPSADGTLEQAKDPRASLPPRPRLLVAYGREEGIGCALPPEEGGEIVIGRGAECALRLDHDPFASSENAAILRRDGRYLLRDLHARNGTWMDWTRLRPGETVPLEDGALIGAGRSLLVAQL